MSLPTPSEFWSNLPESEKTILKNAVRHRHYRKRMRKRHPELADTDGWSDVLFELIKASIAQEGEEERSQDKEEEVNDSFVNVGKYVYDQDRDVYVLKVPHLKDWVGIDGEKWRAIRSAYSNWDDAPMSINEIALRNGYSRQTIIAIKDAMGMTHDSAPWTPEHMDEVTDDDLVNDLRSRRLEKIQRRYTRHKWEDTKKDAERYQRLELFAKAMMDVFRDIKSDIPKDSVPKLDVPSRPWDLLISPSDLHWGIRAFRWGMSETRDSLFKSVDEILTRAVPAMGKPRS